jgi:peptidoglycan-N-acetylglucosamine deacetylase
MSRMRPLALSAFLVLLSALAPAAGKTAQPGICWRPDALKGVAAERATRRHVPGAHMPAPALVPYTPIPLPAALRGSIRRVALPPGVKLLALTFDLCEANGEVTGYDGGVVDYLRAHNIKATFFAGGKWMETHGERAQQLIADPLFQVGNHTWSHRNLRKLSGRPLEDEITRAEAAYEQTRNKLAGRACLAPAAMTHIPLHLTVFRFPYGTCSPAAMKAVGDAGMAAIQWDVVTGDPAKGQTAQRIAAVVLKHARPGSIIVAHANGKGRETARALALFVPKLLAQGYRFVTVGELLAAGKPVVASTCYEERPGDNDRY